MESKKLGSDDDGVNPLKNRSGSEWVMASRLRVMIVTCVCGSQSAAALWYTIVFVQNTSISFKHACLTQVRRIREEKGHVTISWLTS